MSPVRDGSFFERLTSEGRSDPFMDELTFLSAVTMAEQVRKKKISPVELVEAHLTKIECLNPKLNAYVRQDCPLS
jgi:hypothetical protein